MLKHTEPKMYPVPTKIRSTSAMGRSPPPQRTPIKQRAKDIGGKTLGCLSNNKLVVAIVCGAVFGFIIGIGINPSVQQLKQPDRYTAVKLVGFPGELLLRALKMLILPLITCSLIVGLANLDAAVSGRIGARAVTYYLSTTALAAILGLMLVSAIQPGKGMIQPSKDEVKEQQPVRPMDSFLDIIRNMFPSNIIKACVQQDKTKIVVKRELLNAYNETIDFSKLDANQTAQILKKHKIMSMVNLSTGEIVNYTTIENYREYKIGAGTIHPDKANFLGLIVFALAVGKIAGSMGEKSKTFVEFISTFNDIVTQLIVYVMWYSPIGIMSLIAAKFAEMENISGTFSSLGLFMVTVIVGLGVHGLLVLPLVYFLFTRKNPYIFLQGMVEAMMTAFGTDSSAATLPITFRCLEENLGIDKRLTRFILPVGATINMDGTALYEATSAIFIAQSVGRNLAFGDYIAISFTSILASVGAAAIPHAGLVTMLIVLDTVGLPSDMVAVIFTVDWFLDRLRTMINVFGDAIGCGIVNHLSRSDLEKDGNEVEEHDENIEEDEKPLNQSTCDSDHVFELVAYNDHPGSNGPVQVGFRKRDDSGREMTYL